MYTATEIQKALYSPDRLFRFRYELLDKENERKGELDNVLDASVSYDSEAEIKRTARFTLAEKDNIDYPSDRIKPYAIYKMPDKEKIIETEYEALDDSTIWRRGELLRTAAPVDLELGPSPNRCPSV